MSNSQIKNFKKIGLKMIDVFQKETVEKQFFNDPRGMLSNVDMACSLLRKEFRKGWICKTYYPKTIRGCRFDELVFNLKKLLSKIENVKKRWKKRETSL